MHPLSQFEVFDWYVLRFMGMDFSLTNSSFFILLSVLSVVFFLGGGLRKKLLIPSKWQALSEMPLKIVDVIIQDTLGDKGQRYSSFLAAVFFFLLSANLLGMLPYSFTATAQFIVVFALAFLVITIITIIGFVNQGWGFFRFFCPQGIPFWIAPLFIPVELVSYLSRPMSLSIRLTANMVAGHSMLKIFAYFTSMAGIVGYVLPAFLLPLAVNVALTGFEFLVAFLQAYVFTMLTSIYLNDALEKH